ncbi:MAG: CAP domain-containing protein, partial [Candidatus Promineifilaceae bacterium]|nr:CAP domain-containing protein [Candidatus Promineifilaceae bacterium]
EYQVRLVVNNELGASERTNQVIVGAPPTAELRLSPSATAGLPFEATVLADSTVADVRWIIDDGHNAEGRQLRHVFWSAGERLITVTVSNQFGETTLSGWVQVLPGDYYLFLPVLHHGTERSNELVTSRPTEQPIVQTSSPINVALQPLEQVLELAPAEQLLGYINEARHLHDLPALKQTHELSVAAQWHVEDMALNAFTGHTGSDGSSPAYRIQQSGYRGGYGGETTAWGMQSALDAVQYWLDSPPHRVILLNPAATEVGVGFTQDFSAPNVWYWTAEFASMNLPVIQAQAPAGAAALEPVLQLLGPPQDSHFVLAPGNRLVFTWAWEAPLQPDQRFAVYFEAGGRTFQVGVVRQGEAGQYRFSIPAQDLPVSPGVYSWRVQLEHSGRANLIEASQTWTIEFTAPDSSESSVESTSAEPSPTQSP